MSENIWNCECGQIANSGKFCINCGKRKPEQAAVFAAEVKPVEAEVIGRTEQPLVQNVPAAAPYIPAAQPAQPVYQTVPANRSYYNTVPVNSAPRQTSSASLILGIFSLVCLFIQPLGDTCDNRSHQQPQGRCCRKDPERTGSHIRRHLPAARPVLCIPDNGQ